MYIQCVSSTQKSPHWPVDVVSPPHTPVSLRDFVQHRGVLPEPTHTQTCIDRHTHTYTYICFVCKWSEGWVKCRVRYSTVGYIRRLLLTVRVPHAETVAETVHVAQAVFYAITRAAPTIQCAVQCEDHVTSGQVRSAWVGEVRRGEER